MATGMPIHHYCGTTNSCKGFILTLFCITSKCRWLPVLSFQPLASTVPLWAAKMGVPSGAEMSVTQYPAPHALDEGA